MTNRLTSTGFVYNWLWLHYLRVQGRRRTSFTRLGAGRCPNGFIASIHHTAYLPLGYRLRQNLHHSLSAALCSVESIQAVSMGISHVLGFHDDLVLYESYVIL